MSEYVPIGYLSGDTLLASMLAHNTCRVTKDKDYRHIVRAAGVTATIDTVWNDEPRITSWFLDVRVDGSRKTTTYSIDDEGLVDRAMAIAKVQERNSATAVMQQAMANLAQTR